MNSRKIAWSLGALLLLAACGHEEPVDVPAYPPLDVPSHLSQKIYPTGGVRMDWYAVDSAKKGYEVDINGVIYPANTNYLSLTPDKFAYTTYVWKVRAMGRYNNSEWSSTATFTFPLDGLKWRVGNLGNNVRLSWNRLLPVDTFEVMLNSSSSYIAIDSVAIIPDLRCNEEYSWKVRSLQGGQPGDWSADSKFMLPLVPPTGLTYTPSNGINATFRWARAYPNDKFTLDLTTDDGSTQTFADIADSLLYVQNLLPEKRYSWQVRTQRGTQMSDWSATKTFATDLASLETKFVGCWTAENFKATLLSGTSSLQDFGQPVGKNDARLSIAYNAATTIDNDVVMSLRGFNGYLADADTSLLGDFDPTQYLRDIPLTPNYSENTMRGELLLASNNSYTRTFNPAIPLSTVAGEYFGDGNAMGNIEVSEVTVIVDKVTALGTLDPAFKTNNKATYQLTFDVRIEIFLTNLPFSIGGNPLSYRLRLPLKKDDFILNAIQNMGDYEIPDAAFDPIRVVVDVESRKESDSPCAAGE